VVAANNRKIGNGKRGKITARIQKIYFEIVRGNHTKFKKWLTEV
jgi:branched-chain amino acid aminotransferase